MLAGHKIDYYSRKQKEEYTETNSNKSKDSKLCPGDIANSFFDTFRSSASQYNDGIQLLMMKSI